MEHRARGPGKSHLSGLENLERHERRMDQVPHLMRQEPQALSAPCRFSRNAGLMLFSSVLADRAGDGIVEASVQCPKVFRADRRAQVHREIGDRLTDVTIGVHDLRSRRAL